LQNPSTSSSYRSKMLTPSSNGIKSFSQAYTISASAASACLWRSVLEGRYSLNPAFFRASASMRLFTFVPLGSPVFLDLVRE